MTLQPFPLSDIGYPAHGWNIPEGGTTAVPLTNGTYPNRYNVFYEGQTVQLNSFAYPGGPFTWRVIQMIPSVNGGKDLGDLIASGNFNTGTASIGFYTTFTLGVFPAGSYCVLFDDLSDNDANWGTSSGRCFFTVLRRHAGFPQVDLLNSTWNSTYLAWKPDGYGRTDTQVDNNTLTGVQPVDMIARAILSMGIGRIVLKGTNNGTFQPNTGTETLAAATAFFTNVGGPYWLSPSTPAWEETVRTRTGWASIDDASNSYDILIISGSSGLFAFVYVKTPSVDGSKVFVKATAGTTGGTVKVQVYYPDASTLVETFDNQTTGGVAAGTAGSNYIKAFGVGGTGLTAISTPTAIGNANRNTIINIVQTLAPLGCTRFEGPFNEATPGTQTAHQFWLFQNAVASAGVVDALAIGPTPVDISSQLSGIETYLDYLHDTAGLTAADFGFAFHDYDSFENGDVNELRYQIEALLVQVYARFPRIELWQTEANYAVPDQTPVFKPSFAKRGVTHQLIWEQYGLPRERNPHWYDSNMFFAKPWALIDANNSLHPVAVLYSVLGQEAFGMDFHHRMDFGSVPANAIFSGSVYGDPLLGSVAVMFCHSNMPRSTVTLKVLSGSPGSLVTVDSCGVTATVIPDASGLVTLTVPEYPLYVRLPPGVTVRVDHVRNWLTPLPSVARGRSTTLLGGSSKTELTDDQFKQVDGNSAAGLAVSSSSLPDVAEITFGSNIGPVSHVVAFCGPAVDAQPGLLQYSVQTYDGSSWTTQAIKLPDGTYGTTLTKTVPASFLHGDGASSMGTTRDQYWREEWIDDIEFQTPVSTFKGFRLNVPVGGLSFGGAVDSAADALMSGYGRSSGSNPKIHLQEIMILSAASPTASGLSAPTLISRAVVQGAS